METGHIVRPDGTINKGKQQHTPGPWRVNDINRNTVTSGMMIISKCTSTGLLFTEEDKANARLIAAAPELLEALKGLYEHCAMIHKVWGEGNNQHQADEAIKAGKQAIAKAEGGNIQS